MPSKAVKVCLMISCAPIVNDFKQLICLRFSLNGRAMVLRALVRPLSLWAIFLTLLFRPSDPRAEDLQTPIQRIEARIAEAASRVPQADPADLLFENAHSRALFAGTGFHVARAPEGRAIAFIKCLSAEVFVPTEPLYDLLRLANFLHATTKEQVILRELGLQAGDPFSRERLEDALRNLRGLGILTAADAWPVEDEDGRFGLLIITRDLWSLRLETHFQITGLTLEEGFLQLSERNLLGRGLSASVNTSLQPVTYGIGERFYARNLSGFGWSLDQAVNASFVRTDRSLDHKGLDGFSASLNWERPFYHLDQPWAFGFPVSISWGHSRALRGTEVLTWDDPSTIPVEQFERRYEYKAASLAAKAIRQWGRDYKLRASFGASMYLRDASSDQDLGESARAFIDAVMSEDRTTLGPFLGVSFFKAQWHSFRDLSTFGLSEDLRLGPGASFSLSLPFDLTGAGDHAVTFGAALSYRGIFLNEGLFELSMGAEGRAESWALGRSFAQGFVDEESMLRFRAATPKVFGMRLVLRADGRFLRQNPRRMLTLGGSNGLRGYATDALYGFNQNRARGNLELRTGAIETAFLRLGAVLFYDCGGFKAYHHSVGTGLRLRIPQLNRSVFRLDLASPLDAAGFTVLFTLGSAQAVPVTSLEDDRFGASVGGIADQP